MGDLPYISSEQGGLIICTELIYEYTIYKRPIPMKNFELKRGVGLIIHHGLIIPQSYLHSRNKIPG